MSKEAIALLTEIQLELQFLTAICHFSDQKDSIENIKTKIAALLSLQ